MSSSLVGYPILDDTCYCNDANGVKQYSFVIPSNAGNLYCKAATSSGIYCTGVAQEDADYQADVLVRRLGISPVYAQCAINPGDPVTVHSASSWASVAVTSDVIVAYADTDADAAGDLLLIMLSPSGAVK